jgi:ribosomal protein S18 acetylase RimI-like enzyme
MSSDDLNEVSKLYLEANQFSNTDSIKNWTKKNLEFFPKLSMVYENNNKIIGSISGNISENIGYIDDIVVFKNYRNGGIGKMLLLNELENFKDLGIYTVKLWIHEKNNPAINFYKKFGFKTEYTTYSKDIPDVPDGEKITKMELKIN